MRADGVELHGTAELTKLLEDRKPGDVMELEVQSAREGTVRTVQVKLVEAPRNEA